MAAFAQSVAAFAQTDWSILPFTKEIQHSETDGTVIIREEEEEGDEEEYL